MPPSTTQHLPTLLAHLLLPPHSACCSSNICSYTWVVGALSCVLSVVIVITALFRNRYGGRGCVCSCFVSALFGLAWWIAAGVVTTGGRELCFRAIYFSGRVGLADCWDKSCAGAGLVGGERPAARDGAAVEWASSWEGLPASLRPPLRDVVHTMSIPRFACLPPAVNAKNADSATNDFANTYNSQGVNMQVGGAVLLSCLLSRALLAPGFSAQRLAIHPCSAAPW